MVTQTFLPEQHTAASSCERERPASAGREDQTAPTRRSRYPRGGLGSRTRTRAPTHFSPGPPPSTPSPPLPRSASWVSRPPRWPRWTFSAPWAGRPARGSAPHTITARPRRRRGARRSCARSGAAGGGRGAAHMLSAGLGRGEAGTQCERSPRGAGTGTGCRPARPPLPLCRGLTPAGVRPSSAELVAGWVCRCPSPHPRCELPLRSRS